MKKKLVSWIIFGLGVVVAGRLAVNVWKLAGSGRRVEEAKKELALAQTEQERLKKELERVSDPEFALREAREKLGLGLPGEVVVILPENKEQESGKVEPVRQAQGKEYEEANWRRWWGKWVRI